MIRISMKNQITTLVQTYAPNTENEYQEFIEQLYTCISDIPTTDEVIIMGDFNAHMGNDSETWKGILGKFGPSDLNNNGKMLIELCSAHALTITNTFYPHKDIHKFTWERRSLQQKSMIDLILVSTGLKSFVTDVKVKRGAELNTDHYMVTMKMTLPYKSKIVCKTSTTHYRI